MSASNSILASNVFDNMRALQEQSDSRGLIEYAQQVKRIAQALIAEDRPLDSAEYLQAFGAFFSHYESKDSDFTYEILHLFPPNKVCTLKLLGTSDKVDEAIIHYKLDRTTHSRANGDGIKHVVQWGLSKGDTRLVESFITHVANELLTNHPDNSSILIQASAELVSTIAWESELQAPVSSEIDLAVASLIRNTTAYKLQDEYWLKMAKSGLHESMLMMMKHDRLCPLAKYTQQDLVTIMKALPADPTPEQAHWITQYIPCPELKQRVLFSPSFDLDAFMVAMEARKPAKSTSAAGDLTFKGLSVFKEWMEPQHLDTPEKKRRVAMLLNNAASNHFHEAGSPNTSKAVREEFDKQGLPGTARRIMTMFKAQELEDELGL